MNVSFYIARRYFFSKKSHHAINLISAISVCGVALTTAAMVCTLSVFNGFHDLVGSLLTAFDPELKITAVKGKYFDASDPLLNKVKEHPSVAIFSESLEDNALLSYHDRQQIAVVKGVEPNFPELTNINDVFYGDGAFDLQADVLDFGVMGIQLAINLGTSVNYTDAVQVYAPKKGERINMGNPVASFRNEELYASGLVFSVRQNKYDAGYVLTSLDFARRLFDAPGKCSSLELRLAPGADIAQTKKELRSAIGSKYNVLDRYEQQEDVFHIMEIEKLIAYIFLSFILLVSCFNIISSLSMLIIDKKADVQTLINLGASNKQIVHIFMLEGILISLMGAVLGIGVGTLLCYLQQTYGLISLGKSAGSFVVDAYPVSVQVNDLLIVLATVLVVGYLATLYPVRYFSRKLLAQQ